MLLSSLRVLVTKHYCTCLVLVSLCIRCYDQSRHHYMMVLHVLLYDVLAISSSLHYIYTCASFSICLLMFLPCCFPGDIFFGAYENPWLKITRLGKCWQMHACPCYVQGMQTRKCLFVHPKLNWKNVTVFISKPSRLICDLTWLCQWMAIMASEVL